MTTRYRVKRGDTPGIIRGTCKDRNGPVDIHLALSAHLLLRPRNAQVATLNAPVTITDAGTAATRGTWSYQWQALDLNNAGVYDMELEVVWPDGDRITFPTEGHNELIIENDLGNVPPPGP